MGAVSPEDRSLAHAQREIADLLHRLNDTVEIAGILANAGNDEEALEILARERRHLSVAVDSMSRDIAVDPPRRPRRRTLIFVAAALAAASLSTFAFAAIHDGVDDAAKIRDAIRRAAAIEDVAARAEALEEAREGIETASLSIAERRVLAHQIDEAERERTMAEKADRVRADVETMTADPTKPPTENDVDRTKADVEDLLN